MFFVWRIFLKFLAGYGVVWLTRKSGGLKTAGSNPATLTSFYLGVTQLVENLIWSQEVAGSSPAAQTNFSSKSFIWV